MLTLPRLPTAVFELHKNSSRRFEYTFDVLGIAQFHCDPHPEWEKELPLGSPHWQTSRRGPRVTPGRPPTATAAPPPPARPLCDSSNFGACAVSWVPCVVSEEPVRRLMQTPVLQPSHAAHRPCSIITETSLSKESHRPTKMTSHADR